MKKILMFLSLTILINCNKETSVELQILNKKLSIDDNINFRLKNNTKNSYLIYLTKLRSDYSDSPLHLNANIQLNNNTVESNYPISDPLWLLDEDGNMDMEDSLLQKKYFECINKDRSNFIILKANESKDFKIPLIDSTDECGRVNYPILEKENSYKLTLKLNVDSSLIEKKALNDIDELKKRYKFKIFHGKLQSNTILLKY